MQLKYVLHSVKSNRHYEERVTNCLVIQKIVIFSQYILSSTELHSLKKTIKKLTKIIYELWYSVKMMLRS